MFGHLPAFGCTGTVVLHNEAPTYTGLRHVGGRTKQANGHVKSLERWVGLKTIQRKAGRKGVHHGKERRERKGKGKKENKERHRPNREGSEVSIFSDELPES